MNVIPSSIDKNCISEGVSNLSRVRSSSSRRMQRRVTLTMSTSKMFHIPSKREAATLGRTTDLRIIAETAIPRSTTELQQPMEVILTQLLYILLDAECQVAYSILCHILHPSERGAHFVPAPTLTSNVYVQSHLIVHFRGHCSMTQRTRADLPAKGSWINQRCNNTEGLPKQVQRSRARRPRGHSVARFVQSRSHGTVTQQRGSCGM
jgi:hypothetical protein